MRYFPKKYMYMNLDTGELLTYSQMVKQAEEEYDFGDYTNSLELWEYYELTDLLASDFVK